jgi:hypothetical protein
MNQNEAIVAICIGFPILCFVFAVPFVILSRRASTIACPNCQERFPETDITPEGVSCPHCDWRLIAVNPNTRSSTVPP